MKKVIRWLDKWVTRAIKFTESGKIENQAELNSEIENKRKRYEEEEDSQWVEEPISTPDTYIITQTGQLMRDPVKRKIHFKRYRVKK